MISIIYTKGCGVYGFVPPSCCDLDCTFQCCNSSMLAWFSPLYTLAFLFSYSVDISDLVRKDNYLSDQCEINKPLPVGQIR